MNTQASHVTVADLHTLASHCAGYADLAPKLYNPLLEAIHDALRTAETGEPPAFDRLRLPDLRGVELHTALDQCANAVVTFANHDRPALAAAMGYVLDVLIRHTKTVNDAAGLAWLEIQRDAIRLMVREYREAGGAIWQ